ncbi:MAG: ABC transporter permease, partial [Deltaproteobacteria bacterium]|nr:ABC transporter permease [Deltaproteobacteria bacterium]
MKLVWFETVKTFSRWRTYIGFSVIALIVIITEVVMRLSADEILYRMLRSLEKDFLISGNVLNGWFVTSFIMNSLHIHIPFLITLVAGDMVSSEATSGTVRLLLIRPPSRSRIITAKYITTLFYTAGLVLFLGLLCILLGVTLFGSGDLIIHHYGRFGIIYLEEAEIPIRMLFALMAAIWSMMVVASIAFLLSTLA